MLVEDRNGQSEVVATFLLIEETEQSLKSMVNVFKNTIQTGKPLMY